MSIVRRILLSDLWAKLFAVVLAVVIWAGVSADQERIGSFPGGISVQLENVPAALVAINTSQQVDVTIVAESALWQTFTQDSFRASVDLAGAEAGVHDAVVRVTSVLPGARIVSVRPQRLLVRLEPLEQKTVPVRVVYSGQADEGFFPGEAVSTPQTVLLSGPRSELTRFEEAIAQVAVSGQREPFTVSVPVLLPSQAVNTLETTVSPGDASVTVPIQRAGTVKSVGVVIRTEGTPPVGFVVSSLTVSPATAVVTGTASALSGLTALATKPIRLNEIRESSQISTELELPDGVRLVDPSSTSASVTVSVQPGLTTNP